MPGCRETPKVPIGLGWGVDACLTAHVDSSARAAYLPKLRAAGITILRERGPNAAMNELHEAGFRVVSFVGLGQLKIEQRGNALPEDLLAVYSAAKAMQRLHGRYVDVWEMVNEPDVGYCQDLPDRLAAFQKAVYLGIKSESEGKGEGERRKENGERRMENEKQAEAIGRSGKAGIEKRQAGAGHTPLVLMGALALPPGPWLERAARNGLLDYTDAYDFHFYGFKEDLAGVIRAHEMFASKWVDLRDREIVGPDLVSGPANSGRSAREARPYDGNIGPDLASEWLPVSRYHLSSLPIWITECGINAVVPGNFLNPARRKLQADFTLATARQAQASENVAVFMPFILVGKCIPQALTLSPDQPLPAWKAYARFARQHPFPSRVLAMPPRDPNPVVMQWLPDNRTAIPHKVSGSYRFWQDQPMRGVLRIYNFGGTSIRGTLEADAPQDVGLSSPDLHLLRPTTAEHPELPAFRSSMLTIPALGRLELPLTFTPAATGYSRDFWEASFLDERGRRSPVYFGLETAPDEDDFAMVPIELGPPSRGHINHPDLDGFAITSESGAWTGINGAVVESDGLDRKPGHNDSMGSRAGSPDPAISSGAAGFGDPAPQHRTEAANVVARPLALKASVTKLNNDPLSPTMAIARVRGLPLRGFLRLQLDCPMDAGFRVRVDLVDRQGQRFTVWENLGASYFGPSDDVWLNLDDFHIYFWGRCSERPDFRPQDIDEIRLRFFFARAHDPRLIRLSFVQKRGGPEVGIQPGDLKSPPLVAGNSFGVR